MKKGTWLAGGLVFSALGLVALNKMRKKNEAPQPPIAPTPPAVIPVDNSWSNIPIVKDDGVVVDITPGGGKGINYCSCNNGCI